MEKQKRRRDNTEWEWAPEVPQTYHVTKYSHHGRREGHTAPHGVHVEGISKKVKYGSHIYCKYYNKTKSLGCKHTCTKGYSYDFLSPWCFNTNAHNLGKTHHFYAKIKYFSGKHDVCHTNLSYNSTQILYYTQLSPPLHSVMIKNTSYKKVSQQSTMNRASTHSNTFFHQLVNIGPHADVLAQTCHGQYCHHYHGNSIFTHIRIA